VILWCRFVKDHISNSKTKIIVLIASIGYGILIEICQGVFTTTRTPDILDVLANSLGATVGLIIFLLLNKTKEATR
jgi:glycopeptide antibiotics resistance protein